MAGTIVETPQWEGMAIIVTHDESGGFWDPVAPPQGDQWGPGSRIPTVIASPFAKKGFVDHTIYDTTSILQFISKTLWAPAFARHSDPIRRSPKFVRLWRIGAAASRPGSTMALLICQQTC